MTVEYLPVIGGEEVQGGFPLCSVLSPGLSFVSPVRYDTSFVKSQVTHQYVWMGLRLYHTLEEKQLAHSWLFYCLPVRISSDFENKEKLPVTFPLHTVSALDSSWTLSSPLHLIVSHVWFWKVSTGHILTRNDVSPMNVMLANSTCQTVMSW